MNDDKALRELFLAQTPQFNDGADFMAKLSRRLDTVEYIKLHQEATIRRYKMAVVVAFVVGIISGAVAITFVLAAPANVPLFTFSVQTSWLLWLSENSRLITATLLSLLMFFGTMSIVSNVHDILRIRKDSSFPEAVL